MQKNIVLKFHFIHFRQELPEKMHFKETADRHNDRQTDRHYDTSTNNNGR